MPEINGVQLPFIPAGGLEQLKKQSSSFTVNKPDVSFDELLTNELSNLKFSNHAMTRMNSRELALNAGELHKLEAAVEKLDAKGARDSLVMLDDKALIVNITNKTVITMMDKSRLTENMISNIDSAYFA